MSGQQLTEAAQQCDHAYEWVSPAGSSVGVPICQDCHAPDPKWLNAVFQDWPEPEFWTAEELRTLAEHMEWLEAGPIKRAVVRLEAGDRPVAWIVVSPENGPTVQVAFQPPEEPVPDVTTPPGQADPS